MTDGYRDTPKGVPTPVFDKWKMCPICHSANTQLRVKYDERSAPTTDDDLRAVTHASQKITVHFFCLECKLESEHRETQLDMVR